MRNITQIRQDSAPVVFLGSSLTMENLRENALDSGREVWGIVDSDYPTGSELHGMPVRDLKEALATPGLEYLVATNWNPGNARVTTRNNQKRLDLLELMDTHSLPGATLVHPTAVVSPSAEIGTNVAIGAQTMIAPHVKISTGTMIKEQCYISHHVEIQEHCVVQIKATITGDVLLEPYCYIGVNSTVLHRAANRKLMTLGRGTLVHPHVLVNQSLPEGAVASLKNSTFPRVF